MSVSGTRDIVKPRIKVMSYSSEVRHRYHSQGLAAGGSALLDAINRGKVHLAKFILDAGEYDVVNTRDFNGKTPLIRAVYIKVGSLTTLHIGQVIYESSSFSHKT